MSTPQTVQAEHTDLLPRQPEAELPRVAASVKDARASRELMLALRHFHLGAPVSPGELAAAADDCLPALLGRFRDTSSLRYEYPLVLHPCGADLDTVEASALATPIAQFLNEALHALAPEDGRARILKDNQPWLERWLRDALRARDEPVDAAAVLTEAGAALLAHLGLADPDSDRLRADLAALREAVAPETQVLGYGPHAPLYLLIQAIRAHYAPRRRRFRERLQAHARGLEALLAIDRAKSDGDPEHAGDGLAAGGDLFDSGALADVMHHAEGATAMSPERRTRIERTLAVLECWREDPVTVHFVHLGKLDARWIAAAGDIDALVDPNPCRRAAEIFAAQASRMAAIFAADRIAELEQAGIYDRTIHDPWFASFGWEGFSQDELLLVPAVIALESADVVAHQGLTSFSRLLSSGMPVHVLVRVLAHDNPGAASGEGPFRSYRTEIGYLGIAHRQAVVVQSSPARHRHLLASFLRALDATRTSVHAMHIGLRSPGPLEPLNAWLVAGAAIEGRAHPFLRVDPQAGDRAASRMDIEGNPQPERDWPMHPFAYLDEHGETVEVELGFTFADYALLIERLRCHFRVVPPACESDALVRADRYLASGPNEVQGAVPFVWAVDRAGVLQRLAVTRELVLASRDRLNFWRAMQELGGVRNRHVELAVERTREEERARAAAEAERLRAEHAEALEAVRTREAGEAMRRLADVLVALDPSALPAAVGGGPAARPAAPEPAECTGSDAESVPDDAAEPPTPEAAVLSANAEPWIDTALCTSCNDCMAINAALFLYNDDKQAVLGDVEAASFEDLVRGAELCPARCIHPGSPGNPDEPGLEGLIARAEPFNQ